MCPLLTPETLIAHKHYVRYHTVRYYCILGIMQVVLYIRDHAVLGFLAQKYHPKTSHNSLAVYVRHSQALRVTPNVSNKFLWNFKNFLFNRILF